MEYFAIIGITGNAEISVHSIASTTMSQYGNKTQRMNADLHLRVHYFVGYTGYWNVIKKISFWGSDFKKASDFYF